MSALKRFLKQRGESLRRGDMRRMAGVDLVVAPARLVPGEFGKLAERVARRDACAIDEAARRDKLTVAQRQRRLGALDRLWQTTRQNPFQIRLGGVRPRAAYFKILAAFFS
jgi:hypothetical protein